mgnify:CR=1 FL=1
MFSINKLTMYSFDDEEFTYNFLPGLNYFRGKNDSGKTEFYKFIDFMFGSSVDIRNVRWYKDTLKKATMEITVDNITYILTRFDDPNHNYLSYVDETEGESIDYREYRDKLSSIFTKDVELLRSIRKFTEEELTYRTFTLFNFLGEKRQGSIQDFFDKCNDIKYSVKLGPILNFVFNKNLEEIYELGLLLEQLKKDLSQLEEVSSRYEFIRYQVNKNIEKLGSNIYYNGRNSADIKKLLLEIKNMEEPAKKKFERNIAALEVMFNNITEQIKNYENTISDAKQFAIENNNRKLLLENLEELLNENEAFAYLVDPLKSLVNELENTISFGQYTINDNTIVELKRQRLALKNEIKRNDSRFQCYNMEEKAKAIALIEDYLSVDVRDCSQEINDLKKEIKRVREEIKVLQNSDDAAKIKKLSQYITSLYKSGEGTASLVDDDIQLAGFKIQYIKKGNILQPMMFNQELDDNGVEISKEVNCYTGSMARHTLLQLCGYLGFLDLLLGENQYPIIPILVIDHISKPFDGKNVRAIGKVINKFYESVDKTDLQIFMFDDEDYTTLGLQPDHAEDLVTDEKSGFNPFYHAVLSSEEEQSVEKI